MIKTCSICHHFLEKPRVRPSLGYAICQKCKTQMAKERGAKIRKARGMKVRIFKRNLR